MDLEGVLSIVAAGSAIGDVQVRPFGVLGGESAGHVGEGEWHCSQVDMAGLYELTMFSS